MNDIDLIAALLAALSSFALGGLWYSPVMFLKPWLADAGIDAASPKGHSARVYGTSIVFAILSALGFGWLVGPNPELADSVLTGLVVGALFVAASFGINYQFANRSFRLWLIDGGYHVVQFLVFGLTFGLLG